MRASQRAVPKTPLLHAVRSVAIRPRSLIPGCRRTNRLGMIRVPVDHAEALHERSPLSVSNRGLPLRHSSEVASRFNGSTLGAATLSPSATRARRSHAKYSLLQLFLQGRVRRNISVRPAVPAADLDGQDVTKPRRLLLYRCCFQPRRAQLSRRADGTCNTRSALYD